MKCGKCEFARINLKDDEDVYYCPFDNKFSFHSGEECHHPYERYRESVAKMVEPQEVRDKEWQI